MKNFFILIICALFLPTPVYPQCVLVEMPLLNRIEKSDVVVEATVSDLRSFWNEQHTFIVSAYEIQIHKIFKGNVESETAEIIIPGGTVGLERHEFYPSLRLSIGITGIFMLKESEPKTGLKHHKQLYFRPVLNAQSLLRYDLYAKTASDYFTEFGDVLLSLYPVLIEQTGNQPLEISEFVFPISSNSRGGPSVSTLSPLTITAGTKSVLTISGSGFGATRGSGYVQFKDANDGGSSWVQPISSEYVSWSANQIQVQVPADAGSGKVRVVQGSASQSSQSLDIEYAQFNVVNNNIAYQPDLINDNGSGGYTLRYNTQFNAGNSVVASFERALDSWRCEVDINFMIGSTTTVDTVGADGQNVITFSNLSGNTLAFTFVRWSGCSWINQVQWYCTEFDMLFDSGVNWEYGPTSPFFNEVDFESVAVHELGHAQQLGHVINSGEIMHHIIGAGQTQRTLSAADIAGGNYMQSQNTASNICGPGVMSLYTGCVTCDLPTNLNANPVTTTSARINWTPPTGVHHYDLRGRVSGGSNWLVIDIPNGASTYKDVFGLTTGLTFEWQMQAYCDAAETDASGWTASSFFSTECPGTDSSWTYPATTNSARLNWAAVPQASKYEIRGRNATTSNWVTIVVNGGSTFKDVFGLSSNTVYEWMVRTWCDQNGNAKSAYSVSNFFLTMGANKLAAEEREQLQVFPNPFSESVTISLSSEQDMINTIRLANLMGGLMKEVEVSGKSKVVISKEGLASGIYLLECRTSSGKVFNRKLMVR